jgi:hypothetical protein
MKAHKHISISGETKAIAMTLPNNGQSRAYIKAMEDAEQTYTKKRIEASKKVNKDLSDE